jgi:hypothetical protein
MAEPTGPWLSSRGGRGHLRRYPDDFEAMCLELNARRLCVNYRCGYGTIQRWMEMLPQHIQRMWVAQDSQRMMPAKRVHDGDGREIMAVRVRL